ncbi:arrestin domain-containing protein 2-like [Dermatophagoides pteronyssinus]|uniref:arrestin domain-containing protein 2-like n=1 Tax=Dermatophagoides pteronyssinus TaxID=6956 RepID=UPI003F661795
MNQVTSVTLVPDRPSATYTSGEVVTGHCIVTVTGEMDFDCIEIKLVGKSRVEIPTNDSSRNNNDKNNGFDKYIKELSLLELVYKPSKVYHSKLSTGKHDIGYSFIVPPNVPSSYDAQFGFIRYKIKAKAGSEKTEFVLSIISPPSISPNELLIPIMENKSKNIGLLNGKTVLLHCEIPRSGFTLGTKVPIKCTINNQSLKRIVLKGALRQEVTFKAHEEERKLMQKLSSVMGATIEPQSELTHDMNIAIPVNLPIVYNTCPIIQIQYMVTAKLKIPLSFDLRMNMPIIITNLPINEPSNNADAPPAPGIINPQF